MNTESTAGEVKLLPCERIRQVEELDPEALLTACNFPVGVSFAYHDEEGAHDPCFVVLPGGASLALNHWDDELTDIARAVFIVRSCNAAIAATRAATETPTPGLTDDVVKELVEALDAMIREFDKFSRYGSPIAHAANEPLNAAKAALAKARTAQGETK